MIKRGVLMFSVLSCALGLLQLGWPGWVALLLVFALLFGVIFTERGTSGAVRLLTAWRGGKPKDLQLKGKKR